VTKIKWIHQLLVYVVDVNLLGDNTLLDTIKKIEETVNDPSNKVSLEVSAEKTKCAHILLPSYLNGGQNHKFRMVNRSSENVAQFKDVGTQQQMGTGFRRK
jgi:uncharacterized radical SAM superfamily protein